MLYKCPCRWTELLIKGTVASTPWNTYTKAMNSWLVHHSCGLIRSEELDSNDPESRPRFYRHKVSLQHYKVLKFTKLTTDVPESFARLWLAKVPHSLMAKYLCYAKDFYLMLSIVKLLLSNIWGPLIFIGCMGFSITSYGKTQENILADSIY